MFESLLVGLSLWGTWLNIQKNVVGWVIWLIANIGWIISFSCRGMYPEAFLYTVFAGLAVWGIIQWSRPENEST